MGGFLLYLIRSINLVLRLCKLLHLNLVQPMKKILRQFFCRGSFTLQKILIQIKIKFIPSAFSGMDSVDLFDSLHLHNTTFAGLQQKPGPHSHNPAVLFSGRPTETIDANNRAHHSICHQNKWMKTNY